MAEIPASPTPTPLEQHHAAVKAARDPDAEARAEAAAFGLFALDCPLWRDPALDWPQLPELRRDLYMARARFQVSAADRFAATQTTAATEDAVHG